MILGYPHFRKYSYRTLMFNPYVWVGCYQRPGWIFKCIWSDLHVCIDMYIYIYVYVYVSMFIYIYTYVHIYIYTCTYIYIYVYVYVHIYIYIHICIYACTHIIYPSIHSFRQLIIPPSTSIPYTWGQIFELLVAAYLTYASAVTLWKKWNNPGETSTFCVHE